MRLSSLDSLRGAAVLLVFCYHSEGALLVSRFGWAGVDLFFVLSGFLISNLLFREYAATGKIDIPRFLIRRGFKIYPLFYLFLAVTIAIAVAGGSHPRWQGILAELFFVQNYAQGLWTHTWSLAVEEHFYIAFVVLLWWMARRGGLEMLPKVIALCFGAALAMRVVTWMAISDPAAVHHVFPTHLRFDTLLGGVLLGYLYTFHHDSLKVFVGRWNQYLGPASLAMLAPLSFKTREDPFMVTIGFSMAAAGFCLLVLLGLWPQRPPQGWQLIAKLGRVSYAFYLWHGPVILYSEAMKLPASLNIPLTFVASVIAAVVTTEFVERPMLRWRDRLFPSRAVAIPAVPVEIHASTDANRVAGDELRLRAAE